MSTLRQWSSSKTFALLTFRSSARSSRLLSLSKCGFRSTAVASHSSPPAEKKRIKIVKQEISPPKAVVPDSAWLIPSEGVESFDPDNIPAAYQRNLGNMRRFVLLRGYLTPEELEGLAHRIFACSRNEFINCVVLANDNEPLDLDNVGVTNVLREAVAYPNPLAPQGFPYDKDKLYDVAMGYNAYDFYKQGQHRKPERVDYLLYSCRQLALATMGKLEPTKIPILTIPHGRVRDAGYAYCYGGYMLASGDTSFAIRNPSRGLSLDPIGMSYVLPRLGQDFKLPCRDYPGTGLVIAMTGYEMDDSDLFETGLATHRWSDPNELASFELSLSRTRSYKYQTGVLPRTRYHGEATPPDANAEFRNVGVASLVHAFTSGDVRREDFTVWDDMFDEIDPSLDFEERKVVYTPKNNCTNLGKLFDAIFRREPTAHKLIQSLEEYAGDTEKNDELSREFAKDLVQEMEKQAPLALCAVHRLMSEGSRSGETIESCIERERRVQAKLMAGPDFEAWGQHALEHDSNEPPPFQNWKHKHVSDVTPGEIEELFR